MVLYLIDLIYTVDESRRGIDVATFQYVSPLFLLLTCVRFIVHRMMTYMMHVTCVTGVGVVVFESRQEGGQTYFRSVAHLLAPHAHLCHH